jgi:hypothetical protein
MQYEKSKIKITKMEVVKGKESVNPNFVSNYPDAPVLQFTMKLEAFNDEYVETQLCRYDDNGKLKNPIRAGFVAKNGDKVVATTAYEILKAIEVSVPSEKLEAWKKLGFSQARFVNIPFEFEVGQGQKDGEFFYKLNTEYQKQRDANYKGSSDGFDVDAFNKGEKQNLDMESFLGEVEKGMEAKKKEEESTIDPELGF